MFTGVNDDDNSPTDDRQNQNQMRIAHRFTSEGHNLEPKKSLMTSKGELVTTTESLENYKMLLTVFGVEHVLMILEPVVFCSFSVDKEQI